MAARKSAESTENTESARDAEITESAENESYDPMKRKVRIRLFKDNGQYKDDLFVSVNGKTFQIQRGIEVEVPEAVAEVIRRSEESDMNTSMIICRAETEYENVK